MYVYIILHIYIIIVIINNDNKIIIIILIIYIYIYIYHITLYIYMIIEPQFLYNQLLRSEFAASAPSGHFKTRRAVQRVIPGLRCHRGYVGEK